MEIIKKLVLPIVKCALCIISLTLSILAFNSTKNTEIRYVYVAEQEEKLSIYVVECNVILKFYNDYGTEDYTLLTLNTIHTYNDYYLTDAYYVNTETETFGKAIYISAFSDYGIETGEIK